MLTEGIWYNLSKNTLVKIPKGGSNSDFGLKKRISY